MGFTGNAGAAASRTCSYSWSLRPGSPPERSTITRSAAAGRTPSWRYVDTVPAGFAGMANPTGSDGNLTADPQFDAGYHLGAGCACVDAADPALHDHDGSRADMGRFGGPEAP